jgi:hypothetical protein
MPTYLRIRASDNMPLHLHATNRNPAGRWHSGWERHHDRLNAHEEEDARNPIFVYTRGRLRREMPADRALALGYLSQAQWDRYLATLRGENLSRNRFGLDAANSTSRVRMQPTPETAVVYGTLEELPDDEWLHPVSSRKFGVEMECITNLGMLVAACQRRGVILNRESYNHTDHTDGLTWKAVSDSSLRYTGSRPGFATVEIVSPVLNGTAGLRQIKLMTDAMAEVGTIVNNTCGLHVHQDAHDMTIQSAVRLAKNYSNAQLAIDKLVAPSRRGDRTYCGPISQNQIRVMSETPALTGLSTERMRNVNFGPAYRAHKSFEFRQHNGSVDFQKIAAWIALCASMMEKAKADIMIESNTNDLAVLLGKMNMPAHLNRYLAGRAKSLKTVTDAEYAAMLDASGMPVVQPTPITDADIQDIAPIFSRDEFGRIIPTAASRA